MATLTEEEITSLFYVDRTLNQMLNDRGYIITDAELEMSREEFSEKYGGEKMKRTDLTTVKIKKNDDSDKLLVYFPLEPKVGIKEIRICLEQMKAANTSRAILIVRHDLSRIAQEAIRIESSKFYFEVFEEKELLMNVTHHAFVPEHRVLATEEKKSLLEKYTLIEKQLPRIQFTDPIARYYGIKRGEVVKIIRQSETSGRYVTYRYCI